MVQTATRVGVQANSRRRRDGSRFHQGMARECPYLRQAFVSLENVVARFESRKVYMERVEPPVL